MVMVRQKCSVFAFYPAVRHELRVSQILSVWFIFCVRLDFVPCVVFVSPRVC